VEKGVNENDKQRIKAILQNLTRKQI